MQIIVDTREQAPFAFAGFDTVEVIRQGLPTGDYSLVGFEQRIAFERKSIVDLIGCLAGERDRFEGELHRGRGFDFFGVVVEGTRYQVWNYLQSQEYLNPKYLRRERKNKPISTDIFINSVKSFEMAYKVHFIFLDGRDACEAEIVERFRLYLARRSKEAAAVERHKTKKLTKAA